MRRTSKKTIALFAMMILLTSVLALIQNISTSMTANAQTTNTCSNLPITASSVTANGDDGVNKPTNVVDNNLSTRWSRLAHNLQIMHAEPLIQVVSSEDPLVVLRWKEENGRLTTA